MASSSIFVFHTLAATAGVLLWGFSLYNGTVWQLLRAVWRTDLDGVPFTTRYTGVRLIDVPIALLVAFFFTGTNGHNPEYQVFLLNAYSNLQPAFVWLYTERSRLRSKTGFSSSPLFYGLLWQCFGAAISLPLCYAQHLSNITEYEQPGFGDEHIPGAIPLAYLIGAVLPVLIGMAPMWQGPVSDVSRTPGSHQIILAAWQVDPIYVSVLLWSAVFLSRLMSSRQCKGGRSAYHWARFSQVLAALTSFAGHLNLCVYLLRVENPMTSLCHMFLPSTILGRPLNDSMLVAGPWLFLKYDFWIFSVANLYWLFCLLSRVKMSSWRNSFEVAALLVVSSALIGPATTVSLGLFWRETRLHERDHFLQKTAM